ncbi:hypothetical protein BaRGS_00030737 [Batillaria attramentaria]|uniref:Uncharacterized protein n=1 Tax=Batillaria attramentaria TaxID=370345 RepID=A0ABD0JTH6_9CAEN
MLGKERSMLDKENRRLNVMFVKKCDEISTPHKIICSLLLPRTTRKGQTVQRQSISPPPVDDKNYPHLGGELKH